MNVGFVFDTVLLQKDKDYYGLTLTYDFFQKRYLDKMEHLTVITRFSKMEEYQGNIDGYKKTNGKNVFVKPIFQYHNIPDVIFKKKKICKELQLTLKQCDKVIIRMPSVLGILACKICEQFSIPYMIEMVACAWDGYLNHTNPMGKIIAPFMYFFTKKRVKKSKYVVYVTNRFLQQRYPTNGKQFACSDVALIESSSKVLETKLKKMQEFETRCFTMCTVANVGMRYKGHVYALKAMKQLKQQGIQIKYYLAGNGNRNYLQKYINQYGIQDQVIFLGSLAHEQVFQLFDAIDVYIQPSLQEGLPRALIEAMSRGCFCIGSDVGGIPELIHSNYIFHKKNVNQLIFILKNLKKNLILEECKRNFKMAQNYEKDSLNRFRNQIYSDFINNQND